MPGAVANAGVALFISPAPIALGQPPLVTGSGREVKIVITVGRQRFLKANAKIGKRFGRTEIEPAPLAIRIVDTEFGEHTRGDPIPRDRFGNDAWMSWAECRQFLEQACLALARVENPIVRKCMWIVESTVAYEVVRGPGESRRFPAESVEWFSRSTELARH